MFIFIAVFVLFLFAQKGIKDSVSRFFIWTFFLLWFTQGVLAQTGFYNLYIPSAKTMVLVAIHMLFFYWGFSSVKLNNNRMYESARNSFLNVGESVEKISKSPVFIILFLLSFVYIIGIFSKYWSAIMIAQSIQDARAENQLQELYGTTYYYLNLLFLGPLGAIVAFLFSYKTFKKRDWMWILMGLYMLMRNSLKGGRIGFLDIFVGVLFIGACLWSIIKSEGNWGRRYSTLLTLLFVGVAMYFIIGLVTAGRYGDVSMNSRAFDQSQETTNTHFYTYYVGPVVAFDYAVKYDYVAKQGGYHYGALTLNSIEEAFFIITNKLGVSYSRPIFEYSKLVQDNYIDIGFGSFNALFTWCLYFYCDLGVLGLMIFPFLIGYLIRIVIFYFYRNPNVFSASLLLIMYKNVFYSEIKYGFNTISFLITICVLLYLSKKYALQSRSVNNV